MQVVKATFKTDTDYMNEIGHVIFTQYAKEDEPFSPDEVRTVLDNVVEIVNKRNRIG